MWGEGSFISLQALSFTNVRCTTNNFLKIFGWAVGVQFLEFYQIFHSIEYKFFNHNPVSIHNKLLGMLEGRVVSLTFFKWSVVWAQGIMVSYCLLQTFLSTLDRPLSVPDNKITRWHPKFPLDTIPEVEPSPLPEPPAVKTYSSAKDVLDKARDMMTPRVRYGLW